MKLSVLDLAYLREGQTHAEAFADMVALAQKTEAYGYHRYWIAEHHNSKPIGSSATQLPIQHVLAATDQIRVGSGGVMLPNHSPYLVAEQFGTLETLYPGRVDLGLGRAPGTDMQTARALRRSGQLNPDFEADLGQLQSYFADTAPVHAYPAAGLDIPLYILGSSTDSAHLAAKLGLPYAFAAHFAPVAMEAAIAIYRRDFQPSKVLDKPYVILALNAILADSTEEAKRLATSQTQAILGVVTGRQQGIIPPKDDEDQLWADYISSEKVPHFGPVALNMPDIVNREKVLVKQMTALSLIGDQAAVRQQLQELIQRVAIDELLVNSFIYDQEAQAKSYELLSEVLT